MSIDVPGADGLLAAMLRHACQQTLRYLGSGHASAALAETEEVFHHGDDPIVADKEAQRIFEEAIRSHEAFRMLNLVAIVGEESIREVSRPREGERVLVVDPLDGSKCWASVKTGYCVAALVLLAAGGRWTVEAAIVATPLEAYTLRNSGDVFYGPTWGDASKDMRIAAILDENQVLGRMLSAVAYKPDDRDYIIRLWGLLPGWHLYTFGGNPTIPQVLTGGLTAAMTLRPTTNWDSVAVLMASKTDAIVGTHDGQRLNGPLFADLFATVLLTGNVTPIPPLIVAKTSSAYDMIVEAIQAITD
jgi:hypothetical protein